MRLLEQQCSHLKGMPTEGVGFETRQHQLAHDISSQQTIEQPQRRIDSPTGGGDACSRREGAGRLCLKQRVLLSSHAGDSFLVRNQHALLHERETERKRSSPVVGGSKTCIFFAARSPRRE